MKFKTEDGNPTLGIKIVLTVLCAVAGLALALYLFR